MSAKVTRSLSIEFEDVPLSDVKVSPAGSPANIAIDQDDDTILIPRAHLQAFIDALTEIDEINPID